MTTQLAAPDVSVVIVNWNTRDMLLACVRSLRRYTLTVSLEIVVVDNGSSDGSIAALTKAYPEVEVVANGRNLGFAAANNRGFPRCRGRYICLVNSDVELVEATLDVLVHYADRNQRVGAMAPLTVDGEGRVRQNCRRMPSLFLQICQALQLDRLPPPLDVVFSRSVPRRRYRGVLNAETLSGCFLMVRRQVLREVGPLDEGFFFYTEDVDWCRRIRRSGWLVAYNSNTRAIHYGGGSVRQRSIASEMQMERSNLRYWRKHHSRYTVTLYRAAKCLEYAFLIPHRVTCGLTRAGPDRWTAERSLVARLRFISGLRPRSSNAGRHGSPGLESVQALTEGVRRQP